MAVSHATRASGSSRMIESRMASLTWSQSLSGWPSVTDSDVNRYSRRVDDAGHETSAAECAARLPPARCHLRWHERPRPRTMLRPMDARSDPARCAIRAALDAADPLRAIPRSIRADRAGRRLPRRQLPRAARRRRRWSGSRALGEHVGAAADPRLGRGWLELPLTVGDQLARGRPRRTPGEVAVADSTTVNLYRVASAALDARPGRRTIVIERSEFPTDRYVVEGLARERDLEIRWLDGDPVEGLATDDIAAALDADAALAHPVGGQLPVRGDRRHQGRDRCRARRRRARPVGPVARRRARSRSISRRTASTSRSAARTST